MGWLIIDDMVEYDCSLSRAQPIFHAGFCMFGAIYLENTCFEPPAASGLELPAPMIVNGRNECLKSNERRAERSEGVHPKLRYFGHVWGLVMYYWSPCDCNEILFGFRFKLDQSFFRNFI